MRVPLNKHPQGGFVLAQAAKGTHSLDVTDTQYDSDGWWNRNLVVLALARFDDGEVQMLYYHPGRTGSIAHCVFEFGDLLARVGLIALLDRTIGKSSGVARSANSAMIAKSSI